MIRSNSGTIFNTYCERQTMKNKITALALVLMLISINGFSQDTLQKRPVQKHVITKRTVTGTANNHSQSVAKKPMYRDTRLGSSTKKYNTYKKNKYGAGAVTTSPK